MAFIASILTTSYAIKGNPKLFWLAAAETYIFSLIAGFSIGQITVGLTFVLVSLAIGSSLKLIKNGIHFTAFGGFGLLVGFFLITFVDDYWLFFPLTLLNYQ